MLRALFDVHTATFIFHMDGITEPVALRFERNGFTIDVRFTLDQVEGYLSFKSCRLFQVRVSRPDIEPPDLDFDGDDSLAKRTDYLEGRRDAFVGAGVATINAVIQYLRSEMDVSQVVPPNAEDFNIANPLWYFEDKVLSHGMIRLDVLNLASTSGTVNHDDLPNLLAYVTNPPYVSLSESLVLDAKRSFKEGNFRRAVVELAMAAEIGTKRAFFADSSPAGAAFDYMESKRPSLPLKEWLSGAAAEAFGEAFSTPHPEHAVRVDHLMRCRNQVVHRGHMPFRDEKVTITPDASMLLNWFNSVDVLLAWLREKVDEARSAAQPQ